MLRPEYIGDVLLIFHYKEYEHLQQDVCTGEFLVSLLNYAWIPEGIYLKLKSQVKLGESEATCFLSCYPEKH